MHSFEHNSVVSPPTSETRTLGGVLEELDITPFTPESVAHYKRERLAAAMEEIVQRRQLVQEVAPAYWERQMLRRLQRDEAFHNPDDDDFRVKFFEIGSARIAVYVRWEKKPLTEALDVPDYVKAKARQIGNLLPDATFTVEQLRSEKKVYDPFLIASYADESYYVEVWKEPEFEQEYT